MAGSTQTLRVVSSRRSLEWISAVTFGIFVPVVLFATRLRRVGCWTCVAEGDVEILTLRRGGLRDEQQGLLLTCPWSLRHWQS